MRGGSMGSGFLAGIERTLRMRGTLVQRMLCAAMMAILSFARLPGGGYCCQGAMFAVLLRQGFCVPAGFAGVMLGFAAQYAAGALAGHTGRNARHCAERDAGRECSPALCWRDASGRKG